MYILRERHASDLDRRHNVVLGGAAVRRSYKDYLVQVQLNNVTMYEGPALADPGPSTVSAALEILELVAWMAS